MHNNGLGDKSDNPSRAIKKALILLVADCFWKRGYYCATGPAGLPRILGAVQKHFSGLDANA